MAVAFPLYPPFPFVSEPTNQNCLSIAEARNAIKAKFRSYRQLLDKKELELLSELDTIEETNKPELSQVRQDLAKLNAVLKNLDDSLGANTLKPFLEEQRILLNKQISHFQRCEKFLSHLSLETSSLEAAVAGVAELVPFCSKAKFREKLEPILELGPDEDEEWYVVSSSWFDLFCDSINLYDPQPNDSWEFPQRIPIDQTDIYAGDQINRNLIKLLHSDAWELLLGFSGLRIGSHSIHRMTYYNQTTDRIEVPLNPVRHNCVLGYVSETGTNSSFSIRIDMECFPSDTFAVLIEKLSDFFELFTSHSPRVFAFDCTQSVSCNPPDVSKYYVKKALQVASSLEGALQKSQFCFGQSQQILPVYPVLQRPVAQPQYTALPPQVAQSQNTLAKTPVAQPQYTAFRPQVAQSQNTLSKTPVPQPQYTALPPQVAQSQNTLSKTPVPQPQYPVSKTPVALCHIPDLNTPVGMQSQSILFAIPNSDGDTNITVYQN